MKQDIIRKQREEKEQADNSIKSELPTKIEIIIPTEFKDPIPVRSPKSVPIPPIKEIDENDCPKKSSPSKNENANNHEINKIPVTATVDKIKIDHSKFSDDTLQNTENKNDEKQKLSQHKIEKNDEGKKKKKYESDSSDDNDNNLGMRHKGKGSASFQDDDTFRKNDVNKTFAENEKSLSSHQKDNFSDKKNTNDPMNDKKNDVNNNNNSKNNDDNDNSKKYSKNYGSNDSNDSSEKIESSLSIDVEVEELSPRRQSVLSPKIQEFQMLPSPTKKKSSFINRISKKILKTVGKVGGGGGGVSNTERVNIPPQSPSAMVNHLDYNYSNEPSLKNDTMSHQSSNDDNDDYIDRKKKEKKDKEDKRKLQEMRGKQDVQKNIEKDMGKNSMRSTSQVDGKANDGHDERKTIVRSQSENIMGTNDVDESSDSD